MKTWWVVSPPKVTREDSRIVEAMLWTTILFLFLQIDLCVPELEEDWGGGDYRKQEEGIKQERDTAKG